MPESATVEDIEQPHIDAWNYFKPVAIYRDNCTGCQPLSMARRKAPPRNQGYCHPTRTRLWLKVRSAVSPAARHNAGLQVRRGPKELLAVVNLKTAPCEMFITVSWQGSTLSGLHGTALPLASATGCSTVFAEELR